MLPKSDLHLHQERFARLDRVLAKKHRRSPFNWASWRDTMTAEVAPGIARLQHASLTRPAASESDTDHAFIDRVYDTLLESAMAGSIYSEIRFDALTIRRPRFIELFRRAEQRVRSQYPCFYAEAIACLVMWNEPDHLDALIIACKNAANNGVSGVNLLYVPYVSEADLGMTRIVADIAASNGLGVTLHAGEFSKANIAAVAAMESVSRIGHATYAGQDPHLLSILAQSQLTVEVCLTANILLGAVPDLESHPLRRFMDMGIPVTLGTNNPVKFGTTIDGEYALAARLGLDDDALIDITRTAINASFTSPERKQQLLAGLGEGRQLVPS